MRSDRYSEEEREEESVEKLELHRYRAGWRDFIYERARSNPHPGQGWLLVTFTLADAEINGTVISDHDPGYLRDRLADYADGSTVSGVTVLEFGKRGSHRIHAHMLADATLEVGQLAQRWRDSNLGFVVVSEVNDLLGAVAYLTKSFGPESLFAVHGRYKGGSDALESGRLRSPERPLPGSEKARETAGKAVLQVREERALGSELPQHRLPWGV